MKIVIFTFCLFINFCSFSQYEIHSNETPSYPELIEILTNLADSSDVIELFNMGSSDYGLPIYLCMVNGSRDSLSTFKKARKETTILFNNAIHPGEPDGINAMLIWLKQVSVNPEVLIKLPVIAFIPAYNIGGMMNRSGNSRVNQNGPLEYGFRGNAQNLDLNRDFIKMDSKNAFTFTRIFHAIDPDIFVDNHVSNGADYQYTLTYIANLEDRMSPSIKKITHESLLPNLKKALKTNYQIDLFPYVDLIGKTPEQGITSFNDLPRYSMGYASLFHSIGFTVETHMLKPFPSRVRATYAFMDEIIKWTATHKVLIEKARNQARDYTSSNSYLLSNYNRVEESHDSILFLGYEHSFPKNKITGLKRLKYDTTAPYKRHIPLMNAFRPLDTISIPEMYFVGRQEKDVIKRLKANKVEMTKIKKDTVMNLGVFRVIEFESSTKPYEGHFQLKNPSIEKDNQLVNLKRGDCVISAKQKNALFIHSVLQPEAEDSYLVWNFFDSYLQQKEYFSSYVFVDKIEEILKGNPTLKKKYKAKLKEDEEFRSSEWNQLYFIYKNSPYFEPTFSVLPIYYQN
ncbi:MAG: hypothetical protein HOH34_01550 [Flavobacteriales bacterium]|nr:hypothetical protein [Flavobacteriales bacterium]